ncbi:MAG: Deoxycytidine deaminase [Parcubacteria group bacterium GW2011_GWE2_39_37]|uniref:Deoxycytidine deaminase n=1 Tax=Candidatus Falkowbacteria bacterium GW2011_GWF2_39_8 TaxID=1618642 RepID=A0A0G0T6U4_9BACT|nr:MAG: Deoxycytidine deaminase [Parcubacteria group bacterium GW2011_GWE2_39_37]KKR33562.1 MAG: Deoxycytidine deaminase [Candidatus Falkowbacteria bacterium GW2011_GWF2_39_8]
MILGIKKLHELVEEIKLVENLCEREMVNPEGAGFDLRLAEVYELEGDGFLGVEERNTPNINLVAKHDSEKPEAEDFFVFKPGKYYLIKTIEKVNLPTTLSGIIFPRTTMFRSGLGLFNGIVQPGYSGELTFGVCNLGKSNIKISFGARIVHITFQEVLGEGNQYRGQWMGGRVATEGQEVQV